MLNICTGGKDRKVIKSRCDADGNGNRIELIVKVCHCGMICTNETIDFLEETVEAHLNEMERR